MSYFKRSPGGESHKTLTRLGALTWILIYGGLLTLLLGLWVDSGDDTTSELLMVSGAIAAGLGVVLIYVRSRMNGQP